MAAVMMIRQPAFASQRTLSPSGIFGVKGHVRSVSHHPLRTSGSWASSTKNNSLLNTPHHLDMGLHTSFSPYQLPTTSFQDLS